MPNFLEQLVAEWYEYTGYFVRRNVNVGKRSKGGYISELDVVAFNPKSRHLVHVEPSMDAHSWEKREKRFRAKFDAGREFIPSLFPGLRLPDPEQIALLVFASDQQHSQVGGGKVVPIKDFMYKIRTDPDWGVALHSVATRVVPEQYVILRTLQFAANYWKPD